MAEREFTFRVISPLGTVFNGAARSVTLASREGEITVLADHMPMVSVLVDGEIRIVTPEREVWIAVSGGFLETGGPGADAIPFSWKLCSGVAHGDFWTTWGLAERAELPGAPPGLGSFKITANVQTLMYVTTFTTQMTRLGWHLYDQRSHPPY